jgi:hypothetical protein
MLSVLECRIPSQVEQRPDHSSTPRALRHREAVYRRGGSAESTQSVQLQSDLNRSINYRDDVTREPDLAVASHTSICSLYSSWPIRLLAAELATGVAPGPRLNGIDLAKKTRKGLEAYVRVCAGRGCDWLLHLYAVTQWAVGTAQLTDVHPYLNADWVIKGIRKRGDFDIMLGARAECTR